MAVTVVGFLLGEDNHNHHQDHCEPLEDYGELKKRPESKTCCTERLKDVCTTVEEKKCLKVTELKCEVSLCQC